MIRNMGNLQTRTKPLQRVASTIEVHELAKNPTKLWDKLKKKKANRKQVKLPIEQYTTNIESPPADGYIRFVCISDTHNQTDDLDPPEGDVLIHAGTLLCLIVGESITDFPNNIPISFLL